MPLTDMVIMPGADYQAACDAVRAKTGDADLLKSGDLPAAISERLVDKKRRVVIETGEKQLEADSGSLMLDCAPGAKMVIVEPAGAVSPANSSILCAAFINVGDHHSYNCLLTTYYQGLRGAVTTADNSAGLNIATAGGGSDWLWRADITYKWTAYYFATTEEYLATIRAGRPVDVDGVTRYGTDVSAAAASYDVSGGG